MMRILWIVGLVVLITISLCALALASEPVAIVYFVAGEASLAAPGTTRRPLHLYDRLPAGTAVEVETGSRVALAFVNGRRYELGERSGVKVGTKDLASRRGSVRALPRVPPLPRLAPIAAEDRPGVRAGAVRVRGEEIDLFPRDGAVTLAEATLLHVRTVNGAARHRIEVEDIRGTVVFQVVTDSSPVSVPAGILAPGARYHLTVKALDRPGPVARGEADFVTLSRKEARARERLREAVEPAEDDDARALLAAVDHALGIAGEPPPAGAVIESVVPEWAGAKAGLQPGDVVLSWSCAAFPPASLEPASGDIEFPYDLLPLEVEESPRRAVTLRGKRGDQEMAWTLTAGEWRVEFRPSLPTDLEALYLEGGAGIEADDLAAAERSWRSAAQSAQITGDGRLAAWFLDRLAEALAEAGKWPEADTAHEEAVAILEREADDRAAAWLLRRWAETFAKRGAWDAAIERFQKALAIDRSSAPKSLAEARTLNALGITAARRGDYSTAEDLLLQALAIREELAPGTSEVTGSLNNLGILAHRRGDLAAAEEYLTKGEELQRRIAPDSADHALFFQNLGNLVRDRGDLQRAEDFHRKALAIFEKVAPDGDGVEDCLGNLAGIAIQRGDLAVADDLLRRSLALYEGRAPDELRVSSTLILLGNLASKRGDLETAEVHYRRALAIQEKISPDGPEAAASLASLGIVAALQRDFVTARTYLQRSLAIKEKLAPESLDVAGSLQQLGRMEASSGGDLARAEDLLRRALTIFETKAPENPSASAILRALAEVTAQRGRPAEALALHRRSLELQRRLSPETTDEAEALYFLGVAERRAGQFQEGTRNLCRAIDILDRQRARAEIPQVARTSFEATLSDYYHACLEGLIELGRPPEAFHVLERGRARSFLSLLAERDLIPSGLPPELAAERRHVNAEYDRVQAQLTRLSSGRDDAEIERLTGELLDLRTLQEQILARTRQKSPRSAALQDPQPLDLAGARAALDTGTVLLEYAVGWEKAWLFVVQSPDVAGPGLSVFPINVTTEALRDEVESFRRLLKNPRSDRAALRARARRLYHLLVRPAERQITRAQRILLSPDGPLHTLPFAALRRGNRYLVEWKPIHSVLSATVYAEMTKSRPARRNPGTERLAAFGDPVYRSLTPDAPADPEVREAIRRGLALLPLPSSGREVKSIAELYPQAQVYVGRDATEEKAKSIGPESHLVHFACHGLLDEKFPLNSALALSIPEKLEDGRDNGLLQAWEIFESLRLDADLVTLSACDTALGVDMGGEGLIGLTRAFQFAGARSVLASLWSVADLSTARFMKRFYGHLRSGKTKDEALRAAQVEQIREGGRSSHPFHWGAFQLFGDWR